MVVSNFKIDYLHKHDMGLGLIATNNIVAGTRILTEKPVWACPYRFLTDEPSLEREQAVEKAFATCSRRARNDFLRLTNNFPLYEVAQKQYVNTPYTGVILSNAIPFTLATGGARAGEVGIFLKLSRLNHACLPNAQATWNTTIKEETLHAIQDIAEGEEITISYCLNGSLGSDWLLENYGFECTCSFCLYPNTDVKAQRESRRNEIAQLANQIPNMNDPYSALKLAYHMFVLIHNENITDWRKGLLLMDLFEIMANMDDSSDEVNMKPAKVFASMAYMAFELCEGSDSGRISQLNHKYQMLVDRSEGQLEPLTPEDARLEARAIEESALDWLFYMDRWPEDGNNGEHEDDVGVKGKGKGKERAE